MNQRAAVWHRGAFLLTRRGTRIEMNAAHYSADRFSRAFVLRILAAESDDGSARHRQFNAQMARSVELRNLLNPERLADPAPAPCWDLVGAGVHLGRLDLDVAIVCVSKGHGDVGRSYERLWIRHHHPNCHVIVRRIPRCGALLTVLGRQHLEPIKHVTGTISKSHPLMQVDIRIADRCSAAAEENQRQDRPGDAPHGERI
jgi:hypothetical protein